MAVGIVLSFDGSPKAGKLRYVKLLAHLVERHMKETFDSVQDQVESAKRRHHVKSIEVWLCCRDPASLSDDHKMIWNSQMINTERELVESFTEKTKVLSSFVQLHPYHILQEHDMCVTEGGKIQIRKV
ncbi:hypothetical protein diail_8912 [Diaporthe ilicicola]|nr:hypothetical protein diail_8912 [Diaporthe ilicicola]